MSRVSRSITPADVTVAILAGGKSRRFGSDKALAMIPGSGLTLLQHAVAIARQIGQEVIIVGGDPSRQTVPGARIVPDLVVDQGPAGGLKTALVQARTMYLLVVAVDQPLVTGGDLALLLDRLDTSATAVFAGREGGIEPLPVALAVDRCRTLASEIEEREGMPLRSLVAGFRPSIVESADVCRRMLDADTRDDLAQILAIMAERQYGEP